MDVSVVTPLVESKHLPSMVLDLKAELDEQFQEMGEHSKSIIELFLLKCATIHVLYKVISVSFRI